ncbi:uncharacterized protein LOC130980851 [Arachis stenosperma]|uniref:uncharacterized protein LOC130980851 n=1 Tax=Arachis stenosperma TaxID=217475 RepID=UPI0025AD8B76|nr:uncharacterized protein LOC130980851 [Arachis stenosperma]
MEGNTTPEIQYFLSIVDHQIGHRTAISTSSTFCADTQLQTPFELGRKILETLHRIEHRNARRFQLIVAKLDGHDPGPPPPDTPKPEPEPETEEPAPEEPAAKAGQADEPQEHKGTEATVEEPVDHIIEEPAAVAEPIVETASEPAGHTLEEPRAHPAPKSLMSG